MASNWFTTAFSRKPKDQDLWTKCTECETLHYKKDLEKNLGVCSKCDHHFIINVWDRIAQICDNNTFVEINKSLESLDPLEFKDTSEYKERIKKAVKKTDLLSAVITGHCLIENRQAVIAVMDFTFMGGSMGSVVGEKITRATEYAIEKKLPLIIFSCSGGARMQEGVLSLMQMAKTSAALARHSDAGLLFISVLCHPTTGGTTASFAMLGDLNIAEPNALIGFAGPRVIEQTIRQKLPEGFQRSEFCLKHGMLDMIVHRSEMRETLSRMLKFLP
ncbi:acetyl-CoA carboxylase, carboxyltransferase subunit beta [Candidatus Riflebacteria bacterium]